MCTIIRYTLPTDTEQMDDSTVRKQRLRSGYLYITMKTTQLCFIDPKELKKLSSPKTFLKQIRIMTAFIMCRNIYVDKPH